MSRNLEIQVTWDEINTNMVSHVETQIEVAAAIIKYHYIFNSDVYPGLILKDESFGKCRIETVSYNGSENLLEVNVEWRN
jgi:hypothetical protein